MRKKVFAALMAAVSIMPAVASAQDGGDRAARMQAREARQQARQDRQGPAPQQQRAPQQRADRGDSDRQGYRQERQDNRANYIAERARDQRALQAGNMTRDAYRADRQRDQEAYQRNIAQDRRQYGMPDRRPDAGRPDAGRPDRNGPDRGVWANGRNDPRVDQRRWTDNRAGWQRPGWNDGRRFDDRARWSGNWRNDRRYDWSGWRYQNRNAFHLPRYYAPYGWNYGYRRFSVGVRLPQLLFGQNYWIDDPWSYRLPEAYGPYRWVRYYNDALLVDVYSGEVVDVINDIFW